MFASPLRAYLVLGVGVTVRSASRVWRVARVLSTQALAVHVGLVVAARLAAQPRTWGKSGRNGDARDHRQKQPRRHVLRARDRHGGRTAGARLGEGPDRLVAVRRRDRDADPRA